MDSPRSSNTSDHLAPPSPYPATVDPSPVDSNGTVRTDHTEVHGATCRSRTVADFPQIEDDAQENEVNEDAMSDIRSPDTDTDEIVSPASHGARVQVCLAQRMPTTLH